MTAAVTPRAPAHTEAFRERYGCTPEQIPGYTNRGRDRASLRNLATANQARNVAAANVTLMAAELALACGVPLTAKLRTAAELRVRYPTASLDELAAAVPGGATKAQVSGALRRLVDAAGLGANPPRLRPAKKPATKATPLADVYRWLHRLREYYTVEELAQLSGVSDWTINEIDAGRRTRVRRETARRILAVQVGDRMPVFEYVPKSRRLGPGGRLRRRVLRWRPADWDWVLVERALVGRVTRAELPAVELERAVRTLARRGVSDKKIDVMLRWGEDLDGSAVTKYRKERHIPASQAQDHSRRRSRATHSG